MNIKEYEHYEAQEHFSGCKKCQKIVDKVILSELKKEREKIIKYAQKLRISSDFTARLNMFKGLGANAIYNKALDEVINLLTN